jgi:hypothetical protein
LFLEQFLDENQAAEYRRGQLLALFPQLEEAANVIGSGSMRRFLEVLGYIAFERAEQLYDAGIRTVGETVDMQASNCWSRPKKRAKKVISSGLVTPS